MKIGSALAGESAACAGSNRAGSSLRKKSPRVLIIEDDAAMRELLAVELRADGFEAVTAGDSYEFLDILGMLAGEYCLGREAISLIVSDVGIPGPSGLDLVEALRCASWATPVILMTAFGSEETHARAAVLGSVVLDKPFAMEDLCAMARRLTGR